MQVCLEYLERYYVLIAFTAYLFEPGFDPESRSQVTLAQWMKRRPELYRYQATLATPWPKLDELMLFAQRLCIAVQPVKSTSDWLACTFASLTCLHRSQQNMLALPAHCIRRLLSSKLSQVQDITASS